MIYSIVSIVPFLRKGVKKKKKCTLKTQSVMQSPLKQLQVKLNEGNEHTKCANSLVIYYVFRFTAVLKSRNNRHIT